MRIAVSGTHSVGKSTLVADIHRRFSGYVHEEEPYRALRDSYPIKFGKDSTRYCNGIQLFYNISRVQQYGSSKSRVVFDRCPVDYIAYSLYTAHHRQTDLAGEADASAIAAFLKVPQVALLASCQRASISSSVASAGLRPWSARRCST
jgi:predicted ATPase